MINKIIDAISVSINSEFGNTHEIYTESVEQGLKEPCFSIFCINPTNDLFLGKRYFRQNQFCIQFFPSKVEPNAECNDVRDRLFNCLEYITVAGDVTRGTKMKGEFADGVLNFFLNYDMFVYRMAEAQTSMEDLSISTDAKG